MNKAINIDKDILSGTPVFNGTRVPVTILFDYLEDDKLAEFLENYPTVSKEQVTEAIKLAAKLVSNGRIINENLN
ncbi:MAG: DUF433 domain-containing protein [Acidobacteriota bacterium]|nr:DUF433 domain-containing protein [Acidobacteriota bacterium]